VEGAYATQSSLSITEASRRLETEIEAHQEIGSHLILFETLTTLEEIRGVAQAVNHKGCSEFAIGLTCGRNAKTLAGVSMAEAVKAFSGFKPLAYFVQCTQYDRVEPALKDLENVLDPGSVLGVYANDGRRWENMCWHGDRVSPETYGQYALKWRDTGARIIGGCCGTKPEHIQKLKELFTAKEGSY
jgi:S-methylmethionine-dependent homocysteine/selenocysteine methylase